MMVAAALKFGGYDVPKVTLPQVPPNERQWLDPEQIKVFVADVANEPFAIPALLALHGLRRSEIMAVNWSDIDLTAKTIRVSGAVVIGEDQRPQQKASNKNRSSTRTIPIMIPELLAALEEGNSLAEFRENMNDFLEAEGYEGITPYQAENIFRTNIQTAYNVGHYKQMTEPGVKALRPYWQYDAVNDSKTRPSHLAMDGRVFMADDPIWDTWFPPNGFKCRCTVKTLSKRQMEQRGLTVETEAPRAARLEDGRFVNILPDPQFDTNPAKVRYQPDLTGYPEPLKKAYQEREKGNTPP